MLNDMNPTPLELELHRAHKERVIRLGGAPKRFIARRPETWVQCKKRVNVAVVPIPRNLTLAATQFSRLEHIKRAVCRHFQITTAELVSRRKSNDIVVPRMISYYVSRVLTTSSHPDIARRHGNRDHTCCLSGARRVASMLTTKREIALAVAYIIAELDPEHRG